MTEKKLAASRANARLSKGPTSAAGKEKVSKNACKHHLYARKFLMPPAWAARIDNTIQPCVATVQDPAERALLFHYLVLGLWKLELFALDTRLLDQHIAHKRSLCRGLREYTQNDARFFIISNRIHKLQREVDKACRAWKRYQKLSAQKQSILQLMENTPVISEQKTLVLAAGAGAGAGTSAAHPLAPQFPYRAVLRTPPQTPPPPLSPKAIPTAPHYDHCLGAARLTCEPADARNPALCGSARPASVLESVRSPPLSMPDNSLETTTYGRWPPLRIWSCLVNWFRASPRESN